MKRFFAILLLTLMLASLTVNAFADTATGTGTITISNATKDKTYTIYKIFDATIDTSVTPTAISYTYTGELTEAANNFFTKDEYGYITRKSEGSSLRSAEIAALATLKGSPAADAIKATGDTVQFNNLPYGYYYIESTLDTWKHDEGKDKTAVSINSAMPIATVIDKNQGPTWFDPERESGYPENPTTDTRMLGKWIVADTNQTYDSKVKANSVNFGDTVSFEVAFNATNYYGTDQILTYFLNDTIAPGFDIKKDTLQVYFNDELKTSDYSVTWDESAGHVTGFTVAAPWHGEGKSLKYPNSANTIFKVTYDAELLPSASTVIAGNGTEYPVTRYTSTDGNINTATFDYRKESDALLVPGSPDAPPPTGKSYHLSPPENTVTFTYALGLTKIDGATDRPLKGAEFTLKKGETTIKAKKATDEEGAVIPGVYEYSIDGSESQFKTNEQGVLVIKGLSDENTYSLTEVKSPNGYNRNTEPVPISFIRANRASYVQQQTLKNDETGNNVTTNYPVNVKPILFPNDQGVALPITGGMGTTIFYILGGGLLFVAILLLITRKRMNNEK